MNLSGAADAYIQIKRGSTLVGVAFRSNVDAAWASPCSLAAVDTPYSLSAVNYVLAGQTGAGTLTYPATTNGSGSQWIADEIMA